MQHLQGSSAASSHDDASQLVVKKRSHANQRETDVFTFRLGTFNASINQQMLVDRNSEEVIARLNKVIATCVQQGRLDVFSMCEVGGHGARRGCALGSARLVGAAPGDGSRASFGASRPRGLLHRRRFRRRFRRLRAPRLFGCCRILLLDDDDEPRLNGMRRANPLARCPMRRPRHPRLVEYLLPFKSRLR